MKISKITKLLTNALVAVTEWVSLIGGWLYSSYTYHVMGPKGNRKGKQLPASLIKSIAFPQKLIQYYFD
jgi:hypothetical protein